jgi:hypothetical protein
MRRRKQTKTNTDLETTCCLDCGEEEDQRMRVIAGCSKKCNN